ncbi:aldehyde dehydrogenase family protein [Mycobacterium arosiense]|uniref:Putative succinate-semialdehyde dehydrogenase [NADP(+)] 2 n=1 Tax=Mycobacterium arosiense ATCC BAA-1401 = DSM 45069 TaxID=1265311 RepID=A0A1W9ZNW3_MYCAI|nr:hypothetical protein BST14_05495 [Mycobacterium arosiense ATCC BAA-1401 = DSM 45069]
MAPKKKADVWPARQPKAAHPGDEIYRRRENDGVEVVTGGYRLDRRGYFVHPTVLTNVDRGMRLYQEGIFGPEMTVLPFDDDDEALALANEPLMAFSTWPTSYRGQTAPSCRGP